MFEVLEEGMEEMLFFWLPGLCVSALIGLLIGKSKGRAADGVIWGLLLGPLGWLIVAVGQDNHVKCPFCRGPLADFKATHCRHCGQQVVRVPKAPSIPVIDPIDAWEAKERAKTVLAVPAHLKGRRVEDD